MDAKIALRDFLVSRRTRLHPGDVGLPAHGPRRVPGLRREEVAALAAVSVDHYIRLERGNASLVSDAVLHAVADALRLSPGERRYLRDLARPERHEPAPAEPAPAKGPQPQAAPRVRPSVRRLLDTLEGSPAYLVGRDGSVLAWNRLATRVFVDFGEYPVERRTIGWIVFTDPRARTLYLDWESKAHETVAYLRTVTGRWPYDRELARHVAELRAASPDFDRIWTELPVLDTTHATCRLRGPEAGMTLELSWETFQLTDNTEEIMVAYTAAEGSPTAAVLRELARADRPSGHGDGQQ
ncbi:helix-turn-helix domain-containing protein [Streptomyces mobaraensis NBRC 13819 = DSM 40847]|uniref:Helix-turn-helix domain-containing protein n=2 Tax=Streptomyces mobaraensis TaxID=35621 RepID=A0A5N5W4Q2_STRMB|nr:helix-turn-helix transcriptional regulator [Streptomyces mobaraensis]EMF00135.1 DNA-binding protein [Streptomyces mobaraensis NBRC 13819 = DSM 40847]KAB7839950.1 helix-turn-helix domain-containing protein [Streptomyces mobaraensis]QTT72514.1 helix-turn-helix domain-containing protein [Streptomyces mobaraensis NBRC 13819 = DSM 40847]